MLKIVLFKNFELEGSIVEVKVIESKSQMGPVSKNLRNANQ